nr:hypothetical protein B0A51_05590 [Rachicladosporium sp. CCFEE 5018]
MSNKPRICVALFHRNAITVEKDALARLGYAMYHWAILIRPTAFKEIDQCTLIDATDGMNFNPITHIDSNPSHDWWYRVRTPANPHSTGSFLNALEIGKLRGGTTVEQIRELLATVPLPRKQQEPPQHCATWAYDAIEMLQRAGHVAATDGVHDIMERAMQMAHRVMADGPAEVVAGPQCCGVQ